MHNLNPQKYIEHDISFDDAVQDYINSSVYVAQLKELWQMQDVVMAVLTLLCGRESCTLTSQQEESFENADTEILEEQWLNTSYWTREELKTLRKN